MSHLTYKLEYKHVAFIVTPKGRIEIGEVVELKDLEEEKCFRISVFINTDVPKELREAIEKDPRVLSFAKMPIKIASSLIMP